MCTITEDNPPAGEALANSKNSVSILEKNLLCDSENGELMLIKVHCAGTAKLNINFVVVGAMK